MSSKSTKKNKPLSIPRTMQEIEAAYGQLCASAGQLQYSITIQTRTLSDINAKLEAVNNEAAARKQLDAQKANEQQSVDTSTSQSQAV